MAYFRLKIKNIMGQHTWFVKDKLLHRVQQEYYDKLDNHEDGLIYLDDSEIAQLNYEIECIDKFNETDYHDLFRTGKRDPDGQYISDIITSKEECFDWINDPENLVSFKNTIFDSDEQELINREKSIIWLNEFWDKYPDGLIYFI